jgi:uncharacterized protein (UPF0335 family)
MNNGHLKSIVERVERLNEEKQGLADDIKQVLAECKAFGYDVKIVRMLIKRRAMETAKRQKIDALLETYEAEVGFQPLLNFAGE